MFYFVSCFYQVIITQESRVVEVHAAVEIDFDQLDSPAAAAPTDVIAPPSCGVTVEVETHSSAFNVTVDTTERPSPPVSKPVKKYQREEKGKQIVAVFFLFLFYLLNRLLHTMGMKSRTVKKLTFQDES